MKWLCSLAYWFGAAMMCLFFLPLVLVAVVVGLVSRLFACFAKTRR